MEAWQIVGLAVALGCDAFAVGMAVGAGFSRPRQLFRLSFHFGLFQFLMPLVGWWGGRAVLELASRWAPWLAAAVLVGLGAHMIWEAFKSAEQPSASRRDPTRGPALVALSLATSIDALGVGFSLGLAGQAVMGPAVVIGLVAGFMTLAAMLLGRGLGARLGRRAGAVGGVILLAIAVKLVW